MFDFSSFMRDGLPNPAGARFKGFPAYNFIGGHNDAASVPVADMNAAMSRALLRDGSDLATYGMATGPQGYEPLRGAVADLMNRRAGTDCTADDILIVSGSLQALDLVNGALAGPGDVVLVEGACYGGALSRLRACGARYIGLDLDSDGIVVSHLEEVLTNLNAEGITPKFLYTIPTVQNPSGSVMPEGRRREILAITQRFGVPIFEDDCYADLIWEGERPPAFYALDDTGSVIYCGSFSKSIAPAIRVGFIIAPWTVLAQLLSLKTDGGTGALEQMMLAEYLPDHFDRHVETLSETLHSKAKTIADALRENFGTAAEFEMPKGGIFIWVTLPEEVDCSKLYAASKAEGVHLNPGAEWSADPEWGRNRMRLCFGNPTEPVIREGVAKLAEICHREFGVPLRSGNIQRD